MNDFKKFYNEKESEYIENFLSDITKSTSSELLFLKNFYNYYFEFIYREYMYSPSPNVRFFNK